MYTIFILAYKLLSGFQLNLVLYFTLVPVTLAVRSKACTVFAGSESGIVGSNPTQTWMCVCVCACVFMCLCTTRGLETS
jgi:hypothetical protein